MDEKHKKKCSPSLPIMKIHIKTTVRFHCNHVRMVKYITTMTTKAGKDMEQGNSLLLQVHTVQPLWQSVFILQKIEI